ncbi:hypothetical protein HMPREF9244_00348 [Alloscardovia omnicolens F0580]|uniref:Uncharacterized protein n=1 Tax=Alloscardovia omnicolens F0580 TaxID=1321816 RepID=U1RE81_9BIFI|nr:hypothetical protein HMPREF9244_00348 [Alloscardovia omnicolens F0580]
MSCALSLSFGCAQCADIPRLSLAAPRYSERGKRKRLTAREHQ